MAGPELLQFFNMSLRKVQDDDILVFIRHINVFFADFETRLGDVLPMDIS